MGEIFQKETAKELNESWFEDIPKFQKGMDQFTRRLEKEKVNTSVKKLSLNLAEGVDDIKP